MKSIKRKMYAVVPLITMAVVLSETNVGWAAGPRHISRIIG